MKKAMVILISCILLCMLVGCTSSLARKATEQAKLAMASKEYEKAMGSYKLAIDEGSSDEQALKNYEILKKYFDIKELIHIKDYKVAKEKLETITDYEELPINDEIEAFKKEVTDKLNKEKMIDKVIADAKELQIQNKFGDSKKLLLTLTDVEENKQKEIHDIINIADKEIKKYEEVENAKKKAEIQAKAEAKAKEEAKVAAAKAKGISESEAVNLVKKYAKNAPIVEVESTDGDNYNIHCYEIAGVGEESHTATWGWYTVNRKTSRIIDFMTDEVVYNGK